MCANYVAHTTEQFLRGSSDINHRDDKVIKATRGLGSLLDERSCYSNNMAYSNGVEDGCRNSITLIDTLQASNTDLRAEVSWLDISIASSLKKEASP